MARFALRLCAGILALSAFVPLPAAAQQESSGAGSQAPAGGGAARPPKAPAKEGTSPSAPGGDAALRKRVEQLEEQIVDLQVEIGTLQSLAKAPASSAPGPSTFAAPSETGASDQARIDGIEMQIRALTQQMEQISAEVRGGRTSSSFQPNAAVMPGPAVRPDPERRPEPASPGRDQAAAVGDAIGGILAAEELPPIAAEPGAQTAALSPADDPKTAYEAAYGHMLQQNYGAAQVGFGEFLKRYPQHSLVPNALYWLGETYYVQRNYADALEAFDIVISAHASSNKAPDSQLKKAMALAQLGKNADACSALRQLALKYPNAAGHVKSKADSERRRVGCT